MDKLNPRVVRNVTLAAAAVCVVTAVVHLLTGWRLPALAPLSMAVVLLGLLYSVSLRRRAGLVSRGYWRVMVALVSAGALMNLAAAVSQLFNALR